MKNIFKFSRKSVFIIMASIGAIFFIGIEGFLFQEYSYQWAHWTNMLTGTDDTTQREESVTENNTEEETQTEEEKQRELENEARRQASGYKDTITCDGDTHNLVVVPNGSPKLVKSPVSLFVSADATKKIYDLDVDSQHYEAGMISGSFDGIGVPSDTKYYVAFYWTEQYLSSLKQANEIRYFVLNNKIYIFSDESQYTKSPVSFPSNNGGEYVQIEGIMEPSVVSLVNYEENASYIADCVDEDTYNFDGSDIVQKLVYRTYIDSDQGVLYIAQNKLGKLLVKENGYIEVDSYHDLPIFETKDGLTRRFVFKDREGFAVEAYLIIEKGDEEFNIKDMVWNDNNAVEFSYVSADGTCSIYSGWYYVFENISDRDVVAIGDTQGRTIYEKKNLENDSETKAFYNEYYVDSYAWHGAHTVVEDDVLLTYSEYLSYHPIVYLKSPYDNGEYIRLVNTEFYADECISY